MAPRISSDIVRAVYKMRESNKSYEEISKFFGKATRAWACNVVGRFNADGTPKIVKPKGRPPKNSREQEAAFVDHYVVKNRVVPAKRLGAQAAQWGILNPVCRRTVTRILKRQKVRYVRAVKDELTLKHKINRIRKCLEWKALLAKDPHYFRKIVFSDEVSFAMDKAKNAMIWVREGEDRFQSDLQQKTAITRGSRMFWGAISYEGPVALVMMEGGVTGLVYRNMLEHELTPFFDVGDRRKDGWMFQQDGAGPHRAKVVKDYVTLFGIDVFEWPSKSPDLSVIERIWGMMKNHLEASPLLCVKHIEDQVPELWKSLVTPELCRNLYDSIPDLIDECLKHHGYRIRTNMSSKKNKLRVPVECPKELLNEIAKLYHPTLMGLLSSPAV